jgi:hypothetical protein
MSVVPASIADAGVLSPSSGKAFLIDGKRASEEILPKNAEKTRSLAAQGPTAAKGARARVNVSGIFSPIGPSTILAPLSRAASALSRLPDVAARNDFNPMRPS